MDFYYNKSLYNRLKVQFPGSEHLQINYSHINQDMFVLSVLNGKTNGTYLEIGANVPISGNNTYIMEKFYGWKGVSVEILQEFIFPFQMNRKNPILCQDALTVDYEQLLKDCGIGPVVDYLSCDIEPPDNTFAALKKIPHDKIRFRVITFEHDHYNGGTGPAVRDESRQFLKDNGYTMIVGDVSFDGKKIEDWWVDLTLIDQSKFDLLKLDNTYNHHDAIYK